MVLKKGNSIVRGSLLNWCFFCTFKVLNHVLIVGTGSSYNRAVNSLNILLCRKGTLVTADHLMIHYLLANWMLDISCLGFLLLGSSCHHWGKFPYTALKDLG